MGGIEARAPIGGEVVEYDRVHLALYAALLDADCAGPDWTQTAAQLMLLDVTQQDSEACWRSHLERARWIVGDGLPDAVLAFGDRPDRQAGS